MGVVAIGAGVVLWWLAADVGRGDDLLARPAGRLGAVMCSVLGVGILVVAARET